LDGKFKGCHHNVELDRRLPFSCNNAALPNDKTLHHIIRSHKTQAVCLLFQWVQRLLHQLAMDLIASEFMAKLLFDTSYIHNKANSGNSHSYVHWTQQKQSNRGWI
jgi:hypothetical protein